MYVTLQKSADPQKLAIGGEIDAARREIIEGARRRPDDVVIDERCAFRRTLLAVLDAALPFEDRPTVEAMLRELREDRAEINLD